MLPDVDEKQITWQNLIETVVSDRLEEDEEPTIEIGYGPSPVEVVSPLLELLRQYPQHYRREYEGEWPELTQEEIERLAEIRSIPNAQPTFSWKHVPIITEDMAVELNVGVDMAGDGCLSLDETQVVEFYRGQIVLAFGIPKEDLEADKNAFRVNAEREIIYWSHISMALCTPSRNKLTGG